MGHNLNSLPPQEQYEKEFKALQNLLEGAGYVLGLKALHESRKYHSGFRKGKDGVPEHHHQVRIALNIFNDRNRLIPAGIDIDAMLAKAFFHDTIEDDKGLSYDDIKNGYGEEVAQGALRLSKNRDGRTLSSEEYYDDLLKDPSLMMIKLYDRRDNFETIYNLAPENQAAYIEETMLLLAKSKALGKTHPALLPVVHHARTQIKKYIQLYLAMATSAADGTIAPVIEALRSKGFLPPPASMAASPT